MIRSKEGPLKKILSCYANVCEIMDILYQLYLLGLFLLLRFSASIVTEGISLTS